MGKGCGEKGSQGTGREERAGRGSDCRGGMGRGRERTDRYFTGWEQDADGMDVAGGEVQERDGRKGNGEQEEKGRKQ